MEIYSQMTALGDFLWNSLQVLTVVFLLFQGYVEAMKMVSRPVVTGHCKGFKIQRFKALLHWLTFSGLETRSNCLNDYISVTYDIREKELKSNKH